MKIRDRLPSGFLWIPDEARNHVEMVKKRNEVGVAATRRCLDEQRWWSIVLVVRFDQKYLAAALGISSSSLSVIEPDGKEHAENRLGGNDVEMFPVFRNEQHSES